MGLKSKDIDHLLNRQLKLTANKPVTKYVLFMTDAYTWLAQIFIGIMELTSFLFYIVLPND